MKKPELQCNLALSVSANILRLRRRINCNRRSAVGKHGKAGDRRYRMAYQANLRRLSQSRLFRVNPFRR